MNQHDFVYENWAIEQRQIFNKVCGSVDRMGYTIFFLHP